MQGFCAETGGAATLFIATFLGVPVSSTHALPGPLSVWARQAAPQPVRWNVASTMVYAWIATIPTSAIIAGFACWAVLALR